MYFCIIFDKLDGYIRKNDATECLALFKSDEKCERIIDGIRYLVMLKSDTSDVCSYIVVPGEIRHLVTSNSTTTK